MSTSTSVSTTSWIACILSVTLMVLLVSQGPDTADASPPELCNGVDDNLDGLADEGAACGCQESTSPADVTYAFCKTQVPWEQAAAACAAQGMHLVTLGDATEDRWVTLEAWWNASGPRWWIGWNDRAREGRGTWQDGSEVTYQNWAMFQPNNWSDSDCGTLWRNGGGWFDASCDLAKSFVCEKPIDLGVRSVSKGR